LALGRKEGAILPLFLLPFTRIELGGLIGKPLWGIGWSIYLEEEISKIMV